jgi:hypothetical protein
LLKNPLQGWKAGQHAMGNNVRPYDPNTVEPPEQVNLTDFSFKMIQVELVDTNKKTFSEKYKVKVPPNVRGRYSDDVVFGSEWRELLADFDKKFFGCNGSEKIFYISPMTASIMNSQAPNITYPICSAKFH